MGGKNFPWFCSLIRVYVYPYTTIVTCLSSNDDNDDDDNDDDARRRLRRLALPNKS